MTVINIDDYFRIPEADRNDIGVLIRFCAEQDALNKAGRPTPDTPEQIFGARSQRHR